MRSRLEDHHLADLLIVLVASALTLVAWHTTFTGSRWWIVGAAAAGLALVVAIVLRDAGLGSDIVFLGLLVGYLVVAGPIATGSLAFHGWATVTGGLTGTGDGFRILLTTHPPVSAEGPVLLPPVLTCLVTAGLGASVATGSPRPAAPLVPVGAMFVLVLLMGQHEDGALAVLGVLMGGLMLLWLWVRSRRVQLVETSGARVTRRSLAAATGVVVAGGLLAVLVVGDDVGAGRYLARDSVDPYPVAGLRTPLDDFRQFTAQEPGARDNLYDTKLFQVGGLDAGSRLRFAALDSYHGQRWNAENDTDPRRFDDRFLHVSTTVRNPSRGPARTVRIRSTASWNRSWVPTVGAVQSFDFGSTRTDGGDNTLSSEVRYDPATGTALLPDGLEGGVAYEIRTRDEDLVADRDMTVSPALDRKLYNDLTGLDPVIGYFTGGAYTQMDALFKVAEGLRKIGYFSDGAGRAGSRFRAGHDLLRLTDDFLLATPTVGDEEQYAAAMALLATRMQVPARVVVGAIVPADGAVRGRDVTAWVELRTADGTWRTLPTETFMSRRPFLLTDPGVPSVRDYTGDPQQDADRPRQEPRDPKKDKPGDEADDAGSSSWWRIAASALLGLVLLLGVAASPLAKWRRRRRRLRAPRPSTRMAGAWEELVDHALDLGLTVPRATRPVQAEALDRARTLAHDADRRIYSAEELTDQEASAFWDLVSHELRELDEGTTRWRRFRARYSLVSLRRSGTG